MAPVDAMTWAALKPYFDRAAPTLELTSWRVFRPLSAHLTEPPQGRR